MDKRIKASRAQEKRAAELTGGAVVPGSGAGYMRKGDVRTAHHLIECKTTSAASYRMDRKTLDKIEREAVLDNREFVLLVEIQGREYAVISRDYFVELTET